MKQQQRYFTKTFTRFFFGFVLIIVASFGVMIWAGYQEKAQQQQQLNEIDNYASPQ